MTGITWLHLSDWHEGRPAEAGYDRAVVFRELLDDIRNREKISPDLSKVDFVVFSGDVAFSGEEGQYNRVEQFFNQVLEVVGLKDRKDRLFIVPGNHDLEDVRLQNISPDLQQPLNTQQPQLSAWIDKYLINTGNNQLLLNPFSSYQDFINRYTGQDDPTYASFRQLNLEYNKVSEPLPLRVNVALLGLNSALMARRKNGQGEVRDFGKLIIGESQVDSRLRDIQGHHVKIAVMHHPLNWLCQDDQDKIRSLLTSDFDFVLYGHRHKYQASQVVERVGDCVIIAAGAIYESREHLNSYNFVHFDPETCRGKVYIRRWDNDVRQWVKAPFLIGRKVAYTGCYEFPPPKIKLPPEPPTIGEEDYDPAKRIEELKKHYDKVAQKIREGTVVPVLGADINFCGRSSPGNPWKWELTGGNSPTNLEIAAYIERQFGNIATIGCPFCDDPPNLSGGFPPDCPLNTKQVARLDLPYLSQYFWSRGWQRETDRGILENAINGIYNQFFNSTDLHEFLRDNFIQAYASKDPTRLQSKKYQFPLIVTTCLDTTLERIFRKNQQPYDWVSYSENAESFIYRRFDFSTNERGINKFGMIEDEKISPQGTVSYEDALSMEKRPVIVRFYGPIDLPRGIGEGEDFAITEDHFISFLFKVISNKVTFPDKLTAKLEESNLWFLGYNLSYWNLRILLNKITHNPSYKWWAVQENPIHLERELWAINNIDLFSHLSFGSLAEYIKEVKQRL